MQKLTFKNKIIQKKFSKNVIGKLHFENRKILLKTENENFYVQTKDMAKKYLSGDEVMAKIVKKSESGRLAEVVLGKIIKKSGRVLLGHKK